MKRIIFTVAAAVVLVLATGLPAASSDLTKVSLTCSDGTDITAEVDADTLEGLVASVQALTLYPAGLSCTLLQTTVYHAIGGVASAWPGGGFIVGGGRFEVPCGGPLPINHWVNFAISAHTETDFAGPVRGGTINFTVPGGQCIPEGHVTSKPTCLKIDAEHPKPPEGAWYAYLWSHVTQSSGSLAASFPEGSDFGSGWKDTGNPGKQFSDDRLAVAQTSSCPFDGSPYPDGSTSQPIVNGNITIHAAQ